MNALAHPVAAPKSSPAARAAGAAAMVAMYAGVGALVLEIGGGTPRGFLGFALGTFLGLVSLAIEIALVERSARTFHAQGVQTTFLSFMMRLGVVAPVTLLLMKSEMGADPQTFALSYCGTFFLYLCWLTWKTYHAPVQYRPARASKGEGIVVKINARKEPVRRAPAKPVQAPPAAGDWLASATLDGSAR